jgi:hypothetical protein
MAYLDISPMLAAMREQPDAFSLSGGWLKHRPSHHWFKVHADGHVIVDAECGCAGLSVRAEQGRQLYEALESWRAEYWVPREINRHFARHFRPTSFWRRWLRKVTPLWPQDRHDDALAIHTRASAESGLMAPERDDGPPPPRPAKPDVPAPASSTANIRRESKEVTA